MNNSIYHNKNLIVIDHPLVKHKLSIMRDKNTQSSTFRQLLNELSILMAYEVTRDMPLKEITIQTPLEQTQAQVIEGKKVVLAAILRAGVGILDGMLSVIPAARVGHIGLYRDHQTLQAVKYYYKMPSNMSDRDVIVVDPMLATGHSAVAAIDMLKQDQPKSIRFVCLLASPQGIATLQKSHPEVPIYTASIDRGLNEKGYILPGLGDAGDRIFGTK